MFRRALIFRFARPQNFRYAVFRHRRAMFSPCYMLFMSRRRLMPFTRALLVYDAYVFTARHALRRRLFFVTYAAAVYFSRFAAVCLVAD